MEAFSKETRSVWERYFGEDNEQSLKLERKLKKFWKTVLKTQNKRFSQLKWVANKSPGLATKTLKDKIVKKISKCFSRLKGLPARESRAEPRKSLCNPCDWTFHSRTSHQNWHASTRLNFATWMTRDWVAKTGQHCFLKFFSFCKNKILSKNT